MRTRTIDRSNASAAPVEAEAPPPRLLKALAEGRTSVEMRSLSEPGELTLERRGMAVRVGFRDRWYPVGPGGSFRGSEVMEVPGVGQIHLDLKGTVRVERNLVVIDATEDVSAVGHPRTWRGVLQLRRRSPSQAS